MICHGLWGMTLMRSLDLRIKLGVLVDAATMSEFLSCLDVCKL